MYNTLIEFRIHIKLVRLTKMCLNETYTRVRVGKNLSEMCPINLLAPELFFFHFSTVCKQNVNNEGTKYVRIMKKKTAF